MICIVMSLIDGIDLHTFSLNSMIDLDIAHYISASLLHAIEMLHSQLIIYRDLKPENVIIDTSTGSLKLIDFGFAK